jgi:hypothetical protein
MTYVRQCVDEGIKFAKIIYEKCSKLKKKSHNYLKSPGIISDRNASLYKSENFDECAYARVGHFLGVS